jgi:hypothetical protein
MPGLRKASSLFASWIRLQAENGRVPGPSCRAATGTAPPAHVSNRSAVATAGRLIHEIEKDCLKT